MVVRKTKTEIVEMIEAWAALESMAARLIRLSPSAASASSPDDGRSCIPWQPVSFGLQYSPLSWGIGVQN
jgi:hypothetical protein